MTPRSRLSADAMEAWGWRIPFLSRCRSGLVGLYLRRKLEDTPVFTGSKQREQVRARRCKETFTRNWRMILNLSASCSC